jgi:hypothetical protein
MPNHITNRLIVEGADKEKSKFLNKPETMKRKCDILILTR